MEQTVDEVLNQITDRRRPPWSVSVLLLLLICVYLVSGFGQWTWWGGIHVDALDAFGALRTDLVDQGEVWRLGASVLLHAGWFHCIVNILNVYFLGLFIVSFYGNRWFWGSFILAGLNGSLLTWALGTSRTVGSSGALFGWIGMLLVIGWKYRSDLQGSGGELFRRSLLGWTILSLIIGELVPFIDNAAHFGGLIVGIAIGILADVKGN